MSKFKLDGAIVAITGASGDLGRGLCDALAARGAKLALMDLDPAKLEAQAENLGGATRCSAWRADVRDMAQLQDAMDAAAAHFGRLDMVIANAGVATLEPLLTQSEAAFERTIDINLNGVWRTFKTALPYVQASSGHLLAIASMASFFHSPMQGAYTASKAGVWALCNSIRVELRHSGVTVGSIHPTFFKTPLADKLIDNAAGRMLYDNNEGLFKLTTLEEVVSATVAAIEKRSEMTVVPRRNHVIATTPNLSRRLTDRLLFKDSKIASALAQLQS